MTTERIKPKRTISWVRGLVCLGVLLLIILGLAFLPGFGSLCAAGVGSAAVLCPLGALEALFAEKLVVPPLVITLVCMIAVVALLGRTFCAWVCPTPHIVRFFHPEGKRRGKAADDEPIASETIESVSRNAIAGMAAAAVDNTFAENAKAPLNAATKPLSDEERQLLSGACHGASRALVPVGGVRGGVPVDSRHFVLVGALVSSAVFGFPVFCLVCPVGLTLGTLVALWIALVDHNPTWMLLVFPIILLLELVVFRKWCHVLCPLGAFMSLVGAKAPVGKPRVNTKKCLRIQGIDCQTCIQICPEQLDPHEKTLSECTRCGLCVERCPSGAISMISQRRRALCQSDGGDANKRDACAPSEDYLDVDGDDYV